MDWKEIFTTTGLLGLLQFFIFIWVKARLESSIKHENNKLLEDYKYEFEVRKKAEKVAEYLALVKRLNDSDNIEMFKKADQLSWELAMWLPEKIYKGMTRAIVSPTQDENELTTVIHVRKLLLGKKSGSLTSDDVAHHGPGIGAEKTKKAAVQRIIT